MAIDEIESETCDNTLSTVTTAHDYNQLEKGAKFDKTTAAEGGGDDINYIDEDGDDDVIFLESESPSNNILIILDEDTEQEQVNNVCKSTNISHVINDIPRKTFSPKHCDLNKPQHGILEEDFDNFYTKIIPPLRQYGRKQKKHLLTPEEHNHTLPSSSSHCQIGDVCDINNEKSYFPGHQIQNDQKNDGLKALSDISEFVFKTSLQTTNEIEKGNVTPAQEKVSSVETRVPSLSSKVTQYTNSSREDIPQIPPFQEKLYVEDGSQSLEVEKSKDIQFYLEKIFETNSLNSSDTPPSPVVVKMKDSPIIISDNGVVTVIYKPEKVRFRREIEVSEPVPSKKPFHEKKMGSTRVSKRKEKCSYVRIQQMHIPNEQTKPNQKNTYVQNSLTKTDRGNPRLLDVKKLRRTGIIRWRRNKYPPLRKVKYRGEMVYKCKDCDFVHPDCVAAVRRHMIRHQPAEAIDWFYCDLCDYRAKRKGNLKIHMILHRNPDDVVWYKCKMCDKKFKHRNGLYSHEKRHIKRDELELYLCDQCSYKTPFKHTLLRHKMNHESIEKKKLLLCNICSYSTYNKYYLSRHKRQTHREPLYKCLLCIYAAKYKANLESHLKTHFPQEEVFYCDSCNFSTNRRYTLTLHNRHAHNIYNSPENQMFLCYNCSYQTRFKRCLVKHMAIHSGKQGSQEMPVKIKTEVTTD